MGNWRQKLRVKSWVVEELHRGDRVVVIKPYGLASMGEEGIVERFLSKEEARSSYDQIGILFKKGYQYFQQDHWQPYVKKVGMRSDFLKEI